MSYFDDFCQNFSKNSILAGKGEVIDPDSGQKSIFRLYNFFDGLLNYLHAKCQRKNDFGKWRKMTTVSIATGESVTLKIG